MNCRDPTTTPSVMLPSGNCGDSDHDLHVVDPPFRRRCIQIVHIVDDLCLQRVPLRFRLWRWRTSNSRKYDGTKIGWHMMSPSSMYHWSARPPLFCSACCGSVSSGTLSPAPPSWKLADSCNLVKWSALNCCSSASSSDTQSMEGCLPPAPPLCTSALQPPPSPRPGLHASGPSTVPLLCASILRHR